MNLAKMRCLLAASSLLLGASLLAQEPAEDEPAEKPAPAKKKTAEKEAPRSVSFLPEPLAAIRSNILDLSESGYFAIDAVEFRTLANGDEAVVWTVRMKRAVTCRHLEAMLREFRDARFYSTIEKRKLEVIATLVYYSERISLGTSSNSLLGKDDQFNLWIVLPTTYQQKLISLRADTLVLRKWRY